MIEITAIIAFFKSYGYASVFGILLLCGFGLPVPEDVSLISGGVISGLGYTDLQIMIAVAFSGVIIGDSTIYLLGRVLGLKLLTDNKRLPFVTEKQYVSINRWFGKYGRLLIFAARFMPGLRTPIFFMTGMSGFASYKIFLLIDSFAAFISVPVWVYIGFIGAQNVDWLKEVILKSKYGMLATAGVIILIIALKLIITRVISKKNEG
jgi:membrane protein DedA with SNARE-associated domain